MSDIYNEFILELYKNPLNFGRIENADLQAASYNALCGDRIELFININGKHKIKEIKFFGSGCAISQASASLLTEYLKGRTIEEAKKIDKNEILKMIKIDLSKNPSRMKCALLVLETLRKMI